MKYPKYLGRFPLGYSPVRVFVTAESGGSAFVQTSRKLPAISIGLDESSWDSVLAVALHEALELSAMQQNAHFEPTLDTSGESGRFMFVMDHMQFSEACGRAGIFLAALAPKLAKAYKRFK